MQTYNQSTPLHSIDHISSVQKTLFNFRDIFTLGNYKQDREAHSISSLMCFYWRMKRESQGWRKVNVGGEPFYYNKELSGFLRDSGFSALNF